MLVTFSIMINIFSNVHKWSKICGQIHFPIPTNTVWNSKYLLEVASCKLQEEKRKFAKCHLCRWKKRFLCIYLMLEIWRYTLFTLVSWVRFERCVSCPELSWYSCCDLECLLWHFGIGISENWIKKGCHLSTLDVKVLAKVVQFLQMSFIMKSIVS